MKIFPLNEDAGLYVLVDEKGHSVLSLDAVKFHLSKEVKNELILLLTDIGYKLKEEGESALKEYIEKDHLKKLIRNAKAVRHNVWEVKSTAHGGRIFFVRDDEDNIIISAVDKGVSGQDQAINRGVKRWEALLKS